LAPNPRIEELRKRLEKEPASRLFAQLAEELRKEGELEDAIRVSREGLQKHPNYPSARMTLGRALLDSGDSSGAAVEFDAVLKAAPDNILASRFLAECYESVGDIARAEAQYRHTLALSPGDKQVTARLEALAGGRPAVAAAAPPPVTVPAGRVATATTNPSLPRVPAAAIPPRPVAVPPPPPGRPPFVAPVPPPPALEPPPIPLVDADEDFELERPYEAPPPAAVSTVRSTAEEALAREFERQAAPPPPPPAPPPLPLPVESEQVFEETDIAGTTLPPLEAAELMTAARKAAEEQRTARFTALDDEAGAAAAAVEVEPEEPPAPAAPGPGPGTRRPGLETLFRFSAFDGDAPESAVSTPDAPPPAAAAPAPPVAPRPSPPAPAPPPPPPPVRVEAKAPGLEPEIVSSTMAELYFTQGHIDKAVDVYRKLLRGGPENEKARVRLIELETLERKMREEAAGPSAAERRAVLERQIARLEALLTVIRKE
jgi:tetratricopeptide (TPR) repeat protein